MTIYLASDHAGFALKNNLREFLTERGYEVEDCGAHEYNESDDYPEYIATAVKYVSEDPLHTRAIILGGSGQGEAMLANRFMNVRAAVYYGCDLAIVRLSREHNNANVLSLGARFLDAPEARVAARVWLETEHNSDTKYARRIQQAEHISRTLRDKK